jgi:hypothetical protein
MFLVPWTESVLESRLSLRQNVWGEVDSRFVRSATQPRLQEQSAAQEEVPRHVIGVVDWAASANLHYLLSKVTTVLVVLAPLVNRDSRPSKVLLILVIIFPVSTLSPILY